MEEEDRRSLNHSLLVKIYDSLLTIATAIEPLKCKDNLLLAFNGGKDTCVMLYLVHVLIDKNMKSTLIQQLQDCGIDISELTKLMSNFKIDKCRYAVFEFSIDEEFPEIIEFLKQTEKDHDIVFI